LFLLINKKGAQESRGLKNQQKESRIKIRFLKPLHKKHISLDLEGLLKDICPPGQQSQKGNKLKLWVLTKAYFLDIVSS